MVNDLAVIFHTVNAVLLVGLLVYAFRMRSIFHGGKVGGSMPYIIVSAFFFLSSTLVGLAVSLGWISADYSGVPSVVRFVAFTSLFLFAVKYVHDWRSLS